jgi:hypothetical protein
VAGNRQPRPDRLASGVSGLRETATPRLLSLPAIAVNGRSRREFFRHKQIYQSDISSSLCQGRNCISSRPGCIVLMSLRPAIPRGSLQRCPLALHQPFVMVNLVAGNCKPPLGRAGEFSTGTLWNFQPVLTLFIGSFLNFNACPFPRVR